MNQATSVVGSFATLAETRFSLIILGVAVLGLAIRFAYLAYYPAASWLAPLGDGFAYRLEAIRIADGLGYTSGIGDVGAETAHHPPGWVTVLGGVAALIHIHASKPDSAAAVRVADHRFTRKATDPRGSSVNTWASATYSG